MDITIHPRPLRGEIKIIPSKSQAHRLLICAALADGPTELRCPETSRDMDATANCLRALGAYILRTDSGYTVFPIGKVPEVAVLPCGESGSTLRFLLPVVGALGVDATFRMEGRLPQRPLSPLWEEMERMGCELTRPTADTIRCQGKLRAGTYTIPGNISSQYITGLLLALPLLDGVSQIEITGPLESASYVTMTQDALTLYGIDTTNYRIPGGQRFHSPGHLTVEGDWSNGAFFLAAQFLGSDLSILGLNPDSSQGDRAVLEILQILSKEKAAFSAKNIPDLIPILSVFAACNHGAVFTDIQRLRLKESDRVESTLALIRSLGGQGEATENTMTIHGTGLTCGTVDAMNDHRIAMAAAIGATVCKNDVTILGAECVEKSYPQFWAEYARLGGNYEFNLR